MSTETRPNPAPPTPLLLLDDELFLEHVAPAEHPERGERLLAVREGLARAAAELGAGYEYTRPLISDATDEQLARVHDAEHLTQLGLLAGKTGLLDSDTYLSAGSVP